MLNGRKAIPNVISTARSIWSRFTYAKASCLRLPAVKFQAPRNRNKLVELWSPWAWATQSP